MSFSCLFFVIITGATLGKSPFSAMQILYMSVVLDTLAALALLSEYPHKRMSQMPRAVPSHFKLMTPFMCREILTQLVYQLVVLTVLAFSAQALFIDIDPYAVYTEPMRDPLT